MRLGAWPGARPAWPAVLILLGACAARSGAGAAAAGDACGPTTPMPLGGVQWESLAETWRLTLVATAGAMTGHQSVGTLSLYRQDAALLHFGENPNITVPVYGTADLALGEIGARSFGDLTSASPASPGVALYVTNDGERGVTAIVRLGSGANRRDLIPFEGAYTALFVRRVDEGAFFGSWASSTGTRAGANGHFCAVRVSK